MSETTKERAESTGKADGAPRVASWLPCAPCDGTGVVYAAGPDYFGNYDSDDCPACRGHGSVEVDS